MRQYVKTAIRNDAISLIQCFVCQLGSAALARTMLRYESSMLGLPPHEKRDEGVASMRHSCDILFGRQTPTHTNEDKSTKKIRSSFFFPLASPATKKSQHTKTTKDPGELSRRSYHGQLSADATAERRCGISEQYSYQE